MNARRAWLRNALAPGAAVAVLAAGVAALRPAALENIELDLYDARSAWAARSQPASPGIVLVTIDDRTLETDPFHSYPLPRSTLAAIVDEARAAGVRAMALDLVLDTGQEGALVDENVQLARAIGAGGVVLGAVTGREREPGAAAVDVDGDARARARHARSLAVPAGYPRVGLTLPLPRFALAADAVGAVSQQQERNGRVYRLRHVFAAREGAYLSLPLATAWLAAGKPPVALQPGALRFGAHRLPTDAEGRVFVRWYGPRAPGGDVYPMVSASVLLRMALARIDPTLAAAPSAAELAPLRGAIAVLCVTASAGKDKRPTPVNPTAVGGEIVANAVDNLLRGEAVRRLPPAADALAALALVLAVALVTGATAAGVRQATAVVAASSAVVVLVLLGWYGLSVVALRHGLWCPVAVPIVGGLVSAVAVDARLLTLEHRDRRFVHDALGRYTSPALVDALLANPAMLDRFGGARQDLTVYFSDIRGFTSFSEAMQPERLVELLNDYLSALTEIVERHGGYVDKYIGDALMALWGAPLAAPDHAARACRAALEMRDLVRARRPVWKERFGVEIASGAGLNTGPMVVGNVGSRRKTNYTVLGDAVNLASRLEGATKRYGVGILIGEGTWLAARDAIVARDLDVLRVKGKREGVRVFELRGVPERTSAEELRWLRRWGTARMLYRDARFAEAAEVFAELRDAAGGDEPSRVYVERCRALAAAPPPPDWDGVFELHEK